MNFLEPYTFQIVVVLIAHWIGDYLLQGNSIANNKGRSVRWLLIHVALYSFVLISSSLLFFSWREALLFGAINAVLHFITDFITSRLSARYRETPRIFYSILGFDQLVHSVTLIVSLTFFQTIK